MVDAGERLGGDDLTFSVDEPLRIIIGGPPHSGKSTLMNLLEDKFRHYQVPVELLDLDLSAPTPLKSGFTQERTKKKWTDALANEAQTLFKDTGGVDIVLGDSVGLISSVNEIISQPADVAILLVSGGHGDYDSTYRKVVRKWKDYYADIHKPLLVVVRSTMNPDDESMFDPRDNYGVMVGLDTDAYMEKIIEPDNACLEGIVFEIAQSFDLLMRSAPGEAHLDLLMGKWPDLRDKKTWTPLPEHPHLANIERDYFQKRGKIPADQMAESFAAMHNMDAKDIETLYSYVQYLEDKCGNHYEAFIDEGLDPYRTNAESFGAEHGSGQACCFCGDTIIGYGNNPAPLDEFPNKCCSDCNLELVIPARMRMMFEGRSESFGAESLDDRYELKNANCWSCGEEWNAFCDDCVRFYCYDCEQGDDAHTLIEFENGKSYCHFSSPKIRDENRKMIGRLLPKKGSCECKYHSPRHPDFKYYQMSFHNRLGEEWLGSESFAAPLTFNQWSDDEKHESSHQGGDTYFEDWLDEELHSHGKGISLKRWGDEEESESEHQHAESKPYSPILIGAFIGLGTGLWAMKQIHDRKDA